MQSPAFITLFWFCATHADGANIRIHVDDVCLPDQRTWLRCCSEALGKVSETLVCLCDYQKDGSLRFGHKDTCIDGAKCYPQDAHQDAECDWWSNAGPNTAAFMTARAKLQVFYTTIHELNTTVLNLTRINKAHFCALDWLILIIELEWTVWWVLRLPRSLDQFHDAWSKEAAMV